MALINVATCNLDQHALDFGHNMRNIVKSIHIAKARGCRLRIGPELEVCGYGCDDHYFEDDTLRHGWEVLEEIIRSDLTDEILCDIGMPVLHLGVRYNCRVLVMNRRIIMIRPKMWLAEDGNYREGRWFAGWSRGFAMEDHVLPRSIRDATGQTKVPFGIGVVQFGDTMYANETCEELFTANNPGITLALSGAEIIGNGSGSHHTLGKVSRRIQLIEEETAKSGGVYLYANQIGCDGSRMYFDGSSIIAVNGGVVAQGSQFTIRDVEVVVATVDLRDVRNYRSSIASRGRQAAAAPTVPVVEVPNVFLVVDTDRHLFAEASTPRPLTRHTLEEEVAYGPACWMWDYLRRSGMNGFLLPMSGGADSAAVAALAYIMCELVMEDIAADEPESTSLADLRRVLKDPAFTPETAKDICGRLLIFCYMGTGSKPTIMGERAATLASEIGARFDAVNIDPIVEACLETYAQLGDRPEIPSGGEAQSSRDIAVQNLQARCRMVFGYFCAQMALSRQRPQEAWPGNLLVLGSANLDEALRGSFTKYDCSSADINPIGGVPKVILLRFLTWAAETRRLPSLVPIAEAHSSHAAEAHHQSQRQKDNMGLNSQQLDEFGRLRMDQRCGPVSMYHKLVRSWTHVMSPRLIADKVKGFFKYYAQNRHKVTTLPPAVHVASHAADDNRYDMRQIVYNSDWPWQFKRLDAMADRDEALHSVQRSQKKRPRDSSV